MWIHLAPKAFELLTTLVQERLSVLSKATLLERLWPGTFVAEANLSNLVAKIRSALGDRARNPRWVQTARGFGYAFCGKALTLEGADSAALERPHLLARMGPLTTGLGGRANGVYEAITQVGASRRWW